MTLKEYLASTGITQIWLAKQVPVGTVAMSRYVNGLQIPGASRQLRFQELTQGKVRVVRDWPNGKSRGEGSE